MVLYRYVFGLTMESFPFLPSFSFLEIAPFDPNI